jgi:hypothetical protein
MTAKKLKVFLQSVRRRNTSQLFQPGSIHRSLRGVGAAEASVFRPGRSVPHPLLSLCSAYIFNMPNPSPVLYLGILGTLAVNRLMLILYGSARLLPERVRSKHDLKPSLADLRPMFQQDWDLCRSSLHVGWPGGPIWSLIFGTDQIRAAESSGLQAGVAYEAIMKPLILYLKEVAAKIVSYNLLHLIQSMWLPFSPIPEPSQCLGSP